MTNVRDINHITREENSFRKIDHKANEEINKYKELLDKININYQYGMQSYICMHYTIVKDKVLVGNKIHINRKIGKVQIQEIH